MIRGCYFLRTTVNTEPFPSEPRRRSGRSALRRCASQWPGRDPWKVPIGSWEEILLYLAKRYGNSSLSMLPFIADPDADGVLFSLTLIQTFFPVDVYLMALDSRFSASGLSNCLSLKEIKRFGTNTSRGLDIFFGRHGLEPSMMVFRKIRRSRHGLPVLAVGPFRDHHRGVPARGDQKKYPAHLDCSSKSLYSE